MMLLLRGMPGFPSWDGAVTGEGVHVSAPGFDGRTPTAAVTGSSPTQSPFDTASTPSFLAQEGETEHEGTRDGTPRSAFPSAMAFSLKKTTCKNKTKQGKVDFQFFKLKERKRRSSTTCMVYKLYC